MLSPLSGVDVSREQAVKIEVELSAAFLSGH